MAASMRVAHARNDSSEPTITLMGTSTGRRLNGTCSKLWTTWSKLSWARAKHPAVALVSRP
eukprot:1488561-Prymnesium_polylepis.1